MDSENVDRQFMVNIVHGNGALENESDIETGERVAEIVKEYMPDPGSVLDVGCRLGATLEVLSGKFPDAFLTGLDVVPDFVTIAGIRLRGQARVVLGDMCEMGCWLDNTFDWVVCIGSIEHALDVRKAARELQRVSGDYVLVNFVIGEWQKPENNQSHNVWLASFDQWLGLFDQCEVVGYREVMEDDRWYILRKCQIAIAA